MKSVFFTTIILLVNFCFSQNEANNWYFGVNAGLDFSSGSPVPLLNSAMDTNEGCAVISDSNGVLLFYTDGSTIYNRNHFPMPNGTGLLGDTSSAQSSIVVPKPNNSNIYYVFTVDDEAGPDGFRYSEVDMTLDGGLGDVTSLKNQLLRSPTTEKLTSVSHVNQNSYWVVAHDFGSNDFLSYLVTDIGVTSTPVISSVGPVISGNTLKALGMIKISPDGTKLSMTNALIDQEGWLFDFDAATGIVSNPILMITDPLNRNLYGTEFSPNSNVVYYSGIGSSVYQFDLSSNVPLTMIQSRVELTTIRRPYVSMQLAPDGKIYVAQGSAFNLNVIENPNVVGVGCSYRTQTISLGGRRCRDGLPSFVQSFLDLEQIQFQNTCLGDATSFNLVNPVNSVIWDFGDPASGVSNSSTALNPNHVFTSAGVYTVTATTIATSGVPSVLSTIDIEIFEQPTATAPQNIEICDSNNDGFHNFDLTQQDTAILNGQSAAIFEVLYFESMAEYINDTPIATPTAYTNNTAYGTQTVIASLRNRGNDDCEAMTSFDIQVFENPLPASTVPPIRLCDNDSVGSDTDGRIIFDLTTNETAILHGQSSTDFELQYFTDASLMLPISNPSVYQNTTATETIYVQMTNRAQANCTATTSFDIEVLALPVINAIVQLDQCDDDNDGISNFNLNEVANEITTNLAANTISFYSDLSDAQNGLNPITTVATYQNTTPSSQTLYARVENVNACYRTAQININVTTTQIPASFLRTIYQCDDGTDLYDGIATFDLTGAQADIAALFPAGQTIDINFYRNELEALSEVNPIVNVNAYENIGYPNSQNIYVRVDNASNDCIGLGHHVTLVVESNPVAPSTIVIDQCDADNDGVEFIDTSTINAQLLQGQTNVDLTFRDANGNLLPNPLPNPFTTASQTITVEMTNSNSLDADGACAVTTQIDIVIEAGVVANPIPILEVCDTDNDGVFAFDTSAIESTLLGAQTGVTVRYEDENGSLLSSPLPNPFNTSSQTITATVINPTNSFCFAQTQIEFVVNLTPEANAVLDDIICDDVSRDNQHLFDLSNYDAQVLNGQAATDFIITYHLNQSDATTGTNPLPNSYTSTSTRETLFVRIENRNNGTCNDARVSFDIGVSRLPIANQPAAIHFCDDSSNDGTEVFDLRFRESEILNGQSITDNLITYHISQSDANLGINELPIDFSNTTASQDIYVRVENIMNTDCFSTTSFSINVYEQPVLFMQEQWAICENDSVELIADLGFDNYLWSTGETTSSIIVDMPGSYSVTVSNDYGAIICEETKDVLVVESTVAVITNVEIEDWSQNNNSVFIEVNGSGDYEYSLDGISYQESNRFDNLPMGDYQIYVRDKNGCGVVEQDIYLLFYPRYFTPNGDGFHDYWQLFNSAQEPENKIYIFDRYGKLMKQIAPEGPGWDGTFNGVPVPSSDYWFLVERANGKSYRGHFTLKR
jgi:gliding motility-associated-like protein